MIINIAVLSENAPCIFTRYQIFIQTGLDFVSNKIEFRPEISMLFQQLKNVLII